ncbi:MAG: hypothetical protein Ct9H300mP14_03590 [Gammaproteobacteria bacterium]|nr:MAG: hypothetical protein Ct9H300mP14_03590 [Gammaproteobacteria bacterium]
MSLPAPVLMMHEFVFKLPMDPHFRLRATLSTGRFPSWFSSSCRIRFRLFRKCVAWSSRWADCGLRVGFLWWNVPFRMLYDTASALGFDRDRTLFGL